MEAASEAPARGGGVRVWVLLGLILAAALGVRLISLSREAVWYDEVMLLQPLDSPNVVEYVRNALPRTPVPPLFMITEYFWSRVAGTDVTALRVWPVICGITGLAALFMLARRLFDARTALIATLWVSFMYWHIHFSQEIRYYPLSSLFVVVSMWSFVELAAAPKPRTMAIHGFVNGCMVWTHPLTAFLCIAQAIFLLLFRRDQSRTLVAWFGIHFVLALSLVAFVASLDQKAASAQAAWIPVPTLWGSSPSVYNFLSVSSGVGPVAPVNATGRSLSSAQPWVSGAMIVFHIAAVFFAARAILRERLIETREAASPLRPKEIAVLLLLWLIVPPTLAFVLSHAWRPMFVVRYVLFASFPLYIFLGYALSKSSRIAIVACFAFLAAYDALFYYPGPTRAPFDQVAATIQQSSDAPQLLMLDDMLFQAPLEYYWRGQRPVFLPWTSRETKFSEHDIDIWLVYSDEGRMRRAVKAADTRGFTVEQFEFRAGRPLWLAHVRDVTHPDPVL